MPFANVSNSPAREYPFEMHPRATPFSKIEPWKEMGGATGKSRDARVGTHGQLASPRWAGFLTARAPQDPERKVRGLHLSSPASDTCESQTLGLETGGGDSTSGSPACWNSLVFKNTSLPFFIIQSNI